MAKWDLEKLRQTPQETDREAIAAEIWNQFKDRFQGERKFALRLVIKYLREDGDRAEREVSIE